MATVLVVDDSAVDRRMVGGLLCKSSHIEVAFAEDGLKALAQIRASSPDLVLTDMQMPRMDGLRLVKAIGLHHAGVPVILMTGKGSEAIAVDALEQGAASYVPKSQLGDRLLETVLSVLARTQDEAGYQRLIKCASATEFHFRLENDPTLIPPLIDLVQQIALGMGICDSRGRLRVGVALEQALLNAFVHGNLEIAYDDLQSDRESLLQGQSDNLVQQRRCDPQYRDRPTHVDIRITHDEARFVVRDEGQGFDVSSIPKTIDPDAMVQGGGRGLVLMGTFMDEVVYNDKGNEVTLIKRRETPASKDAS
ncbi:MAG: response regulator [Pirellulales bacterium]